MVVTGLWYSVVMSISCAVERAWRNDDRESPWRRPMLAHRWGSGWCNLVLPALSVPLPTIVSKGYGFFGG